MANLKRTVTLDLDEPLTLADLRKFVAEFTRNDIDERTPVEVHRIDDNPQFGAHSLSVTIPV